MASKYLTFVSFLLYWYIVHASSSGQTQRPIIDLGYVRQQATSYDNATDVFVFKNIRYAQAPTHDLRFRSPQPPAPETTIRDGSSFGDRVCPQGFSELSGISNSSTRSEDCLFLNVVVPRSVLNGAHSAPVLVWIHGGAFTMGSKDGDGFYNPRGLFESTKEAMIYVAINYRLGAYGWLAPPGEDIVPNIGLLDIQAALRWVTKYISLFGGNPAAITAMGESAGSGSILHLITAYGGARDPPTFQRAIAQSPGVIPAKNNPKSRTNLFQAMLNNTGCNDLNCLRKVNTSTLMEANAYVTSIRVPDSAGFGPVVDGDMVPDIPGKLILEGAFHKTLEGVISANNAHEGALFTGPPESFPGDEFDSFVEALLPQALTSNTTRDTLTQLYPPAPAGDTLGDWERTTDFISDLIFTCNAQYLAKAFSTGAAYRYIFGDGSAVHGSDVPFTFYLPDANYNFTVEEEQMAKIMQKMITSFVTTGVPRFATSGQEQLPLYGAVRNSLVFNGTRPYLVEADPWDNARCAWWQRALYAQS